MSVLMRASEVAKRPVVTLEGEDVAQIKDIIYSEGGGAVGGFTLNGRSRLSGPLKTSLPWPNVGAFGPDAVMIEDESKLVDTKEVVDALVSGEEGTGGDVLGSQVLTDEGKELGKVLDVIIEVSDTQESGADVVGYEIEPAKALGKDVKKILVPLPDTIAASGQHLIVPASAEEFMSNDLAGFGAAMEDFRSRLKGQ